MISRVNSLWEIILLRYRAVDDWNIMIDNNIRGYLHAIGAVLPHTVERGSGYILGCSPAKPAGYTGKLLHQSFG